MPNRCVATTAKLQKSLECSGLHASFHAVVLCDDVVDNSRRQRGRQYGTGITATENITDTENLLGSNVAEITDAISATKQETGVTVHLLYLASFNTEEKPAKWASALLESLDPKPNTVLLAVASNDGNLVVAVSSNSDEWLKKKSTVDALSDAAQKPLMESTPDWSKSATDMMDQIAVQKKTSTSSQTVLLGVGGMIAVLVLLIVIMVVFHILRKRGIIKRKVRKHAEGMPRLLCVPSR